MSKNGKIYIVWIFLNTLYLTEIILYIKIIYQKNDLEVFLIGIAILFSYYIFLSWLKNINRCFFWLIKKYNILILRLFPLCLDFSSKKLKIEFDKGMFEFGNIYTYPKLKNRKIDQYIQDSERIAKIEKYVHIVFIAVSSILVGIVKVQMGIIALTLQISTFLFLNVESGTIFSGSLYDSLEKGTLNAESVLLFTVDLLTR